MDKNQLLEDLAALEHDQWARWASSILLEEKIAPSRADRWKTLLVAYDELPEPQKDQDRKWARKVLEVLEKHGVKV